ncbi:MAG TPA: hypothetical protein VMU11_03830 [Verrucomicrobiae bacterium]|nr:hypothetical protein [Verrucomicrobiae bacterium]
MRLYNPIPFLVLAVLSGCGPVYSQLRTRAVTAETTPFTRTVDSDTPADSCESRRRSQREQQLAMYCRGGVTEACGAPERVTMSFDVAVNAVCVGAGLSDEECAAMRARLPAGATVESDAPPAPPTALSTASQLLAYRFLSDPVVWSDVEAICSGRSMGFAYGGGYGGFGGYGMGFGPTCGAGAICGGMATPVLTTPTVMPVTAPVVR